MASTAVTPAPPRQEIAPVWHTVLFVLLLLAFSYLGAKSTHPVESKYGHIAQYATMIVSEWLMVLYTWWGVRKRGRTLRSLIAGRWNSFEAVLLDIGIALAFWLCALLVLGALGYALRMTTTQGVEQVKRAIQFLAPQTPAQLAVFIVLSLTAGFCEELIFRGYFQQQFIAFSNTWIGIVASGVLFGVGHGYQGWKQMVRIAVFGVMFGVLAHFRKSLRPGMIAHAWTDSFSGTVLYILYRLKIFK
jgi:membrane protease YdiL (CAAX protease family)